jgi:hypothetical protein
LSPLVIVVTFLPRPSDSLAKCLVMTLLVLIVSAFHLTETGKFRESLLSAFAGFTFIVSNYSLPLQNLSDHEIQNYTVLRIWLIFVILLLAGNFYSYKEKLAVRKGRNHANGYSQK